MCDMSICVSLSNTMEESQLIMDEVASFSSALATVDNDLLKDNRKLLIADFTSTDPSSNFGEDL
jgi:hypothetical protein